jgi:hypothetical protein
MTKKFLSLIFSFLLFASFAKAQSAEVTVSFNEQFFDAVLDSIFKNLKQPEFPLAEKSPKSKVQSPKSFVSSFNYETPAIANRRSQIENPAACREKIVLHREINGVRTAARFREGRIYAPIAFSGSYNPPLIGCLDFQGIAETNIELVFDKQKQALIGKVKVYNVQLGNVANMAGGVLARFIQNSIDKRINPIEILKTDRLAFIIPVQHSGEALNIRATNLRHEIGNGVLNVFISFEFSKAG